MSRCVLCGTPCRGSYCYAHAWAAGSKSGRLNPRSAGSSELVGSRSKPRRPDIPPVESEVATNHSGSEEPCP